MSQIKKFQKLLTTDYALFINLKESDATDNIFYFLQRKTDPGVLLIPKRGKPTYYTGGFLYDMYKKILPIPVKELTKLSDLIKTLKGTIGLDFNEVNATLYKKIKNAKDISKTIEECKVTKLEDEIACTKKACQISKKIFDELPKKGFTHEGQVKEFLRIKTAEYGCEPAFEPIVASGKDAAIPHYRSEKKIAKGFCIVDYGVRYKGYRSDITRTFYRGKPTKKDIALYDKVLTTQKKALERYTPKHRINDVHKFAQKELPDMCHALGHGVGLLVHELPMFGAKEKFKPGMIVTCEPGSYVEGKYGIRIEDDILITKGKPMILSKISKKLTLW